MYNSCTFLSFCFCFFATALYCCTRVVCAFQRLFDFFFTCLKHKQQSQQQFPIEQYLIRCCGGSAAGCALSLSSPLLSLSFSFSLSVLVLFVRALNCDALICCCAFRNTHRHMHRYTYSLCIHMHSIYVYISIHFVCYFRIFLTFYIYLKMCCACLFLFLCSPFASSSFRCLCIVHKRLRQCLPCVCRF